MNVTIGKHGNSKLSKIETREQKTTSKIENTQFLVFLS
jgi:hypothetical protein